MNKSGRLGIRLLFGRSTVVGPGKAELLALIESAGSISAAGRAMGMSYKKAWYLVDTMNRSFKSPVVEACKGGRGGGRARLTAMGRDVLARYRKLEARAAKTCAAELKDLGKLLVKSPPED